MNGLTKAYLLSFFSLAKADGNEIKLWRPDRGCLKSEHYCEMDLVCKRKKISWVRSVIHLET
jgi:hypothetical protein